MNTSPEPEDPLRSVGSAGPADRAVPDTALPHPVRLLLVEDNRADATLIRALLRKVAGDNCVVTTAVRLSDAREQIGDGQVDCVLLDLNLPDTSGLDTVAGIVSASADVPIVVLTGLDDESTAMAAVHQGVQDYLSKSHLEGRLLWHSVWYSINRKRTELAIRHQATHDALTGLANRGFFVGYLEERLARLPLETGFVAVMLLDLDRFKWVNDSLGHDAGDTLLADFAGRLQHEVRPPDLVARLGGDEFLLASAGLPSEFAALRLAERIQAALDVPFTFGDSEVWLSVSIGLAVTNNPAEKAHVLIRNADTAMYRAKDRGRAHCELYDAEMRKRAEGRLQMSADLRRGLESREFVVQYQPIVSLTDGHAVGAEALVRWRRPVGTVLPEEFIELAEETGAINQIGDVVLAQACRQLALWENSRPGESVLVTVNVSARQLADARFPDRVHQIITETGIDPHHLGLEVTETSLMVDEQASLEQLIRLKVQGVQLYIDDFGTGFSSLTYLQRFPFDVIKIDMSFTQELGSNGQGNAIVGAVVQLGGALGLQVVAEGVETQHQVDSLLALGCRVGQGHFFARATPAELVDPRTGLPTEVVQEVPAAPASEEPPAGPEALTRPSGWSRRRQDPPEG